MRWTLLLLLLLCSCATQRQAEKYFNQNTDQLAEYVDKNEAYTRQYGAAYAARHFPPRFYPPAIYLQRAPEPARLTPSPVAETYPGAAAARYRSTLKCPDCESAYITKTVYLQDTLSLDSLSRELKIERLANQAIRKRLKDTEADRDYWQEMNRKKRWALIAMAVFAVLYILFKVLAARVREA